MTVRLSSAARRDLDDIWDYSARRWNEAQAERYLREIGESLAALGEGTIRGRSIDAVREGTFKLPVGSHVVFYRTRGEAIEVVRILHQRMDVERHL